jgi:hypothetical protein
MKDTTPDFFGTPGDPWPVWIPKDQIVAFKCYGDDLQAWTDFDAWIHTPAGGEIANRFLRLSIGAKRRGFVHFGAQAIIERLRWNELLKNGPNPDPDALIFKVSHNWRRRLSVWAMLRAPELKGFFRIHERTAAEDQEGGDHAEA